jgi:hypothetical protein
MNKSSKPKRTYIQMKVSKKEFENVGSVVVSFKKIENKQSSQNTFHRINLISFSI